jgi:hypothetical protein
MSGSSNNECEAMFGIPNMAFIRDAGLVSDPNGSDQASKERRSRH